MRILVTTFPACGHFFPMVAFTWALRAAGHEVLVAGPRSIAKEARNAGLPSAVAGDTTPMHVWTSGRDTTGQLDGTLAEFGVAMAEHTVDDLIAVSEAWRPDAVLTDPMDLAGPLVAACHRLPLIAHRWGLQWPEELLASVTGEVLTRVCDLHDRFGQAIDAGLPDAVIDNCPPSLRRFESNSWMFMRYVPYCGTGIAPSWLLGPRPRPRVCVSMGSIPVTAGVHGLRVAADALGDLPVDVVVAGAGSRSSELTDLPSNARAAGWVPHDQLLPTCDLVVHHGGAGSAMASLVQGLPQLVLPQMGDQFANADQLVSRGVGKQITFADRDAGAVRDSVVALLGDESFRDRAREVQAEITEMRPPIDLVGDVERVARGDKAAHPDSGTFPAVLASAARQPSN